MDIYIYRGMEVTADVMNKKFNLVKENFSKDISISNMEEINLLYQFLPHSLYPFIYKLEHLLSYSISSIKELMGVIQKESIKDKIYIEGHDWLLELSLILDEEKEAYLVHIDLLVRDLLVDKKRRYEQIFEIKSTLEKIFLITSLKHENVKFHPYISADMYCETSYKLYNTYLKHNKFIELYNSNEGRSIIKYVTFTLTTDYVNEIFDRNTDETIEEYTKIILNKQITI